LRKRQAQTHSILQDLEGGALEYVDHLASQIVAIIERNKGLADFAKHSSYREWEDTLARWAEQLMVQAVNKAASADYQKNEEAKVDAIAFKTINAILGTVSNTLLLSDRAAKRINTIANARSRIEQEEDV